MANEIDVYSPGEIAPYDPGMPVLAPLSPTPDTWGRTEIDAPTPRQSHPSGPTLFGAALPAGATPQHAQIVLAELGGLFLSDFTKLNYPSHLIQSAITFFMENATKPARQVTPRHNFKLPNELNNDWLAQMFANHLQTLGGTQAQKQQFLNASLAWIDKLNAKLSSQQVPVSQPRTAPSAVYEDSLSDAEWIELNKRNEALKLSTEITLRRKWGTAYTANMEVVQAYYDGLPMAEKNHLNQVTSQGVGINTPEVLEFLFNSAIGAGNIPTSAGGVQAEINQIEALMREPASRAAYLKDNQLQARLRRLYTIRDKG